MSAPDEPQGGPEGEPQGEARPGPAARLVRVFVDPARRRPRALVRIALHLIALGALVLIGSFLPPVLPSPLVPPVALASVIAVTWAFARFVDRRDFSDLGLRVDGPRALDLVAGIAVGGLAIGGVALAESALGVARYEAMPLTPGRVVSALLVVLFFVAVAVEEELVFRGYQVVNLVEGLEGRLSRPRATAAAVALSAAVFGLAHASNEGATVVSTVNVALAGGALLSAGFVLSGDLAFSIGVHFAWNLAQCLLGMPVSGFVVEQAALAHRTIEGADPWTGGAFGPEASVLGLSAMLMGAALAVAWGRLRYGPLDVRLRTRP